MRRSSSPASGTRVTSFLITKLKRAGAKTKFSDRDALNALGTEMLSYSQWKTAAGLTDTTFRRKRDTLIAAGKVEQIGAMFRRKTT